MYFTLKDLTQFIIEKHHKVKLSHVVKVEDLYFISTNLYLLNQILSEFKLLSRKK